MTWRGGAIPAWKNPANRTFLRWIVPVAARLRAGPGYRLRKMPEQAKRTVRSRVMRLQPMSLCGAWMGSSAYPAGSGEGALSTRNCDIFNTHVCDC